MNPTQKNFHEKAQLYLEKFGHLDNYFSHFEVFLEHLPENAHILDLACGPGNITKYLLQKRPDLIVMGVDFAPNMIEIAQKENPKALFQIMDMFQIDQIEDQFHGIICGFGLPYASKEQAFDLIQKCASNLLPNGKLFLSTMEDNYSNSEEKDGVKMYFHEKEYLKEFMLNAGFEVSYCKNQKFTEPGYDLVDLIMIGRLSHGDSR